jgi:hypothetical protein
MCWHALLKICQVHPNILSPLKECQILYTQYFILFQCTLLFQLQILGVKLVSAYVNVICALLMRFLWQIQVRNMIHSDYNEKETSRSGVQTVWIKLRRQKCTSPVTSKGLTSFLTYYTTC